MDTQKLNVGWVIIAVSGLIAKEISKMVRGIQKRGAQKLAPRTFAVSCVRGHEGMEKLVNELRALGTKETSFQAIFVTRAQWERSFMVHGLPATQDVRAANRKKQILTKPNQNQKMKLTTLVKIAHEIEFKNNLSARGTVREMWDRLRKVAGHCRTKREASSRIATEIYKLN